MKCDLRKLDFKVPMLRALGPDEEVRRHARVLLVIGLHASSKPDQMISG
jgi:hypothetical protein